MTTAMITAIATFANAIAATARTMRRVPDATEGASARATIDARSTAVGGGTRQA
jgi:hypothetical protein